MFQGKRIAKIFYDFLIACSEHNEFIDSKETLLLALKEEEVFQHENCQAAADKAAADVQAAADKIAADKIAADKIDADVQAAADKTAADVQAAVDKIAADKIAADVQAAADKAAADVTGEVFCRCKNPSHGKMIQCENPSCDNGKWFHFGCVGLTAAPRGKKKWFCPQCTTISKRQKLT